MPLRPNQALIVALAVPGLGHVLQQRPVRGVMAFVLVVGAMVAGHAILGGRLWFGEAIPGLALPLILPELLAPLPTLVLSMLRDSGGAEAARLVQLPAPGESIGFLLTGAAGFLSAFQAADAAWFARRESAGPGSPRPATPASSSPACLAAISWVLPGVGHCLRGQRSKGVLIGAAVWLVFLAGMFAGAGHACDRGLHPVWWSGASPFGGGLLFAAVTTGSTTMTEFPPFLDLGVVLCTVAGLMNVIVMTDAYTVAERAALWVEAAAADSAAAAERDAASAAGGLA